jgi:hypothetical protein
MFAQRFLLLHGLVRMLVSAGPEQVGQRIAFHEQAAATDQGAVQDLLRPLAFVLGEGMTGMVVRTEAHGQRPTTGNKESTAHAEKVATVR